MKRNQLRRILVLILLFTLLFTSCGNTASTTKPDDSETRETTKDTRCPHEFDPVAGTPPTCTENGCEDYRVCRLCGAKDGYVTLLAAHSYVTVPAKEATEQNDGYTEHQQCTLCGEREGYTVIPATHEHRLDVRPDGESNPMFYRCRCGFSVVSDLRSRPLIDQLTDKQFEQFLAVYNMIKNGESRCDLAITSEERELFHALLQGQCPELFLLEYENAGFTLGLSAAEWNPDCMSDQDYADTCNTLIQAFLKWEKDSRYLTHEDKIQYIVRWMMENIRYSDVGSNVRSLYGAVIELEACCVGYSQILTWFMNSSGVPCMSVTGTVTTNNMGHMWNLVQLDGAWYQVDPGWNYVAVDGTMYSNDSCLIVTDADLGIGSARIYYEFFKKSGLEIPACKTTARNLARLDGRFVQNSASIANVFGSAFAAACKAGDNVFTLICEDKSIQDAIVSYARNAGDVAAANGVKRFWNYAQHNDGTRIYSVTLRIALPNTDKVKLEEVDPQPGTGYKLAIRQNENGQILFFSGATTGDYLSTVADPARATDVFYKEVDGGFRLWFMDGYLKKYVDIVVEPTGSAKATISLVPTAIYRLDDATGAIVATVSGKDYWLGTYNEFPTVGANRIAYISDGNASNIGVSQFPAELVTVEGIPPVKMAEPEIPEGKGTAYKLMMEQNRLGETLYLLGYMDGNYLGTTKVKDKSPNVYVEETGDGYQLYYLLGENKMYIHVYGFQYKQVKVHLRPTPGLPFTYRDDLGIYVIEMYQNEYYLGSYKDYDNFSVSAISYITGDNASKVGVSQFPAYLVLAE